MTGPTGLPPRAAGRQRTANAIALGLVAACLVIGGTVAIDQAQGGPWYLATELHGAPTTFEVSP